jgi:hypothetical protein
LEQCVRLVAKAATGGAKVSAMSISLRPPPLFPFHGHVWGDPSGQSPECLAARLTIALSSDVWPWHLLFRTLFGAASAGGAGRAFQYFIPVPRPFLSCLYRVSVCLLSFLSVWDGTMSHNISIKEM